MSETSTFTPTPEGQPQEPVPQKPSSIMDRLRGAFHHKENLAATEQQRMRETPPEAVKFERSMLPNTATVKSRIEAQIGGSLKPGESYSFTFGTRPRSVQFDANGGMQIAVEDNTPERNLTWIPYTSYVENAAAYDRR